MTQLLSQWCISSSSAMAVPNLNRFTSLFQIFCRSDKKCAQMLSYTDFLVQDCNDRNPLIRALAIRTMSYIPLPVVTDALSDNLRHCLKDRDPYVRKTA